MFPYLARAAMSCLRGTLQWKATCGAAAHLLITASLLVAGCGVPVTVPSVEPTAPPAATEFVPEPTFTPDLHGPPEDAWGVITYKPGEPILLGVAGPLSGDQAATGEAILRGAELAVRDVGSIAGFNIQLVKIDDASDPVTAAESALADPQLAGVVGHAFSSTNRLVIPIYERHGTVVVSPNANFADLTDPGSPVFNRVSFSAAIQGRQAAEHVLGGLSLGMLAIVYRDAPYDQGIATAAQKHFETLGGTVVLAQAYPADSADFATLMSSLESAAPQAIFLVGSGDEAAVFLKQAIEFGLLEGVYLLGADELSHSDTFRRLAEQAVEAREQGVAVERVVELAESPERDAFVKDHALNLATGDRLILFSYDAAGLILHAISRVAVTGSGGELYVPRQTLADAVRGTAEFPGLTGRLTCDEHGDCSAAFVNILVPGGEGWKTPSAALAPADALKQIVEASGLLPVELVDLESANGLLSSDGQSFELLGAATTDQSDRTIGVLYIADIAKAVYPPGLYLIQSLGDPPSNPELSLVREDGETFMALDAAVMSFEELGKQEEASYFQFEALDPSRRYFLFLKGSTRCQICFVFCWCYRCKG